MQINILILVGLIVTVAWAGKKDARRNKPQWAERLQGWQMIFALAGFAAAFLMILNPEFLALGLLGDAAFFDLLVLTLSLQFRNLAFVAWNSMNRVYARLRSFAIRSLQRDYAVVVFTLTSIGSAALTLGKVALKYLRHHDHLIS